MRIKDKAVVPVSSERKMRALLFVILLILLTGGLFGLKFYSTYNSAFIIVLLCFEIIYIGATWNASAEWSYRGSKAPFVVLIDLATIFGLIVATGGVESEAYLILGAPLLFTAFFYGSKGTFFVLFAVLASYTLMILAYSPIESDNVGGLMFTRYIFFIGSTLLMKYVAEIVSRETKRLSVISEIGIKGSGSLSLKQVTSEIAEKIVQTLAVDISIIFLYDEAKNQLEPVLSAAGIPETGIANLSYDLNCDGPIQKAFRENTLIELDFHDRPKAETSILGDNVSIRDMLIQPFGEEKRCSGVMIAANRKKRGKYKDFDRRMLSTIANKTVVYIENTVLYRKSEENVAQLTSLLRVVDAIGTLSDIETIFDLAIDVIKGLFACDRALINIINRETGLLEAIRHVGFSEEYVKGRLEKPFERIDKCYVLTRGEEYLTDDIRKDIRCPYAKADTGTISSMCVLIRSGERFYGIIHMASRYKKAFTRDDVALANAIGEQVGMAVERAMLFKEINRLAVTDELTGIYNVRQLRRVLDEEIRRCIRYKRKLSFMMIDIDYFKNYNDHNGHLAGDEVLRRIARLLESNIRDIDVAFRYGGEEFSILIREESKEKARVLAERLRQFVEETEFENEVLQPGKRLTISIGISGFPDDAEDAESLIEKADIALYMAKERGRNQVVPYTQEIKRELELVRSKDDLT